MLFNIFVVFSVILILFASNGSGRQEDCTRVSENSQDKGDVVQYCSDEGNPQKLHKCVCRESSNNTRDILKTGNREKNEIKPLSVRRKRAPKKRLVNNKFYGNNEKRSIASEIGMQKIVKSLRRGKRQLGGERGFFIGGQVGGYAQGGIGIGPGGRLTGTGGGKIAGGYETNVYGPGYNVGTRKAGSLETNLQGELFPGMVLGSPGTRGVLHTINRAAGESFVGGNVLGKKFGLGGQGVVDSAIDFKGGLRPVIKPGGIGVGGDLEATGVGHGKGDIYGYVGDKNFEIGGEAIGRGSANLEGEAGLGLGLGPGLGGKIKGSGEGEVIGSASGHVGNKKVNLQGAASGRFQGNAIGDITDKGLEGKFAGDASGNAVGAARYGDLAVAGKAKGAIEGAGEGGIGWDSNIQATGNLKASGEVEGVAKAGDTYIEGVAGADVDAQGTAGYRPGTGLYGKGVADATGYAKGDIVQGGAEERILAEMQRLGLNQQRMGFYR